MSFFRQLRNGAGTGDAARWDWGYAGIGSILEGQQVRPLGKYNANILEDEAQRTRQSFELVEQQKLKSMASVTSTQVAMYAKSGVKMSEAQLTF